MQYDWDLWLPKAFFAFNTAPHEITKFSPFELVFGRLPPLALEASIFAPPLSPYLVHVDDYMTNLTHFLTTAWRFSLELTAADHPRQARNYNRKLHLPDFTVGQSVWLSSGSTPKGLTSKFLDSFTGPYIIARINSPVVYLRAHNQQALFPTHINRLKPVATEPKPALRPLPPPLATVVPTAPLAAPAAQRPITRSMTRFILQQP